MPGTGLFTEKTSTLFIAINNVAGEAMFAKSVGTPPSTAGLFGVGCLVIDTTNSLLYINTGTVASPTWNSIGGIAPSEITLATNQILIGAAGGVAAAKAMSGDATIVASGAITIGALKVVEGMINTGAITVDKVGALAITAAKLAADAVTNAKILDGTILNAKLGGPKIGVIQQTVAVADFDDSAASAAGFIDLTDLIPAGSVVMQSLISALTGFAGDTSATIQIGDGSTAARYSTGTPDVFSDADHISAGAVSGTDYDLAAITLRVTITGATDFSDIVTEGNGEVTITVFYYTP